MQMYIISQISTKQFDKNITITPKNYQNRYVSDMPEKRNGNNPPQHRACKRTGGTNPNPTCTPCAMISIWYGLP